MVCSLRSGSCTYVEGALGIPLLENRKRLGFLVSEFIGLKIYQFSISCFLEESDFTCKILKHS